LNHLTTPEIRSDMFGSYSFFPLENQNSGEGVAGQTDNPGRSFVPPGDVPVLQTTCSTTWLIVVTVRSCVKPSSSPLKLGGGAGQEMG
jgi:hypothetical protein